MGHVKGIMAGLRLKMGYKYFYHPVQMGCIKEPFSQQLDFWQTPQFETNWEAQSKLKMISLQAEPWSKFHAVKSEHLTLQESF